MAILLRHGLLEVDCGVLLDLRDLRVWNVGKGFAHNLRSEQQFYTT